MKKRWFVNFLISFFVILITIGVFEIALRLFAPLHFTGFTDAFHYDPDLGYKAMPGHHLSLTDYQQEMYVNAIGTINFQRDFQGYKNLVFAVGDSYTQGTGLPADASYPFQLDLMLNLYNHKGRYRYSKDYGIVNLGLAAYGGEQSYIVLKRYINLIGKPKLILYMGCDNDPVDDQLFRSGIRHKNIVKDNPRYGVLYHPIRLVFYKSEIGKRFRYVIQEKVIRKSAANSASVDSGHQTAAHTQIPIIEKVIALAKENGSTVILSWSGMNASYDYLKEWAIINNIQFADWQPLVNDISENIVDLPLDNPHSGLHYRTWVNSMIAQSFNNEIQKAAK
jgi:hypothetical protein